MANEGTKNEGKPEQQEGPKVLPEAERLKLTHELAMKLSHLTPNDRRLVLTSVATSLGVASSTRPQGSQQRQQPRNGGR